MTRAVTHTTFGAGMGGMTESGISADTSVARHELPTPRDPERRVIRQRVSEELAAVRVASERLERVAGELDDAEVKRPSLLPGWTRGHVLTHLARNADALVNLLTWARTGVEHQAYASNADRDADIQEGASRLAQVIREDLAAAGDRFLAAAEQLTDAQWRAWVAHRSGRTLPAYEIPAMRLFEVWVHLVDLNVGVGLAEVPAEHLNTMLERAVSPHARRDDGTPVRVHTELPDGRRRHWTLAIGDGGAEEVSGSPAQLLAWLTGRDDGSDLTVAVPELPPWG